MDTLSFILSIPLRIIGLILSVPIVLIGKLYDLLFKRNVEPPRTILITGANSGICKEVALQYAAPGIHLILVARNMDRLKEVEKESIKRGATVFIQSMDVSDTEKIKSFIQEQDRLHPIDLIIAGVGVVTPANNASMSLGELYDFIISANIITCKNTILPIIDSMRARKHGQICILSSVAGLGMNIISLCTHLAKWRYLHSVKHCVVCYNHMEYVSILFVQTGYTDTPILDTNTGKDMGYKLSPVDVATTIVDGLKNDYAVIECNMAYNLGVAFAVQYIPKLARDYVFRMVAPIANRHGLFVNEYPSLEAIYEKEKVE